MNALSGSMAPTASDGYIHLSRELWGEVVTALASNDRNFRMDVHADMLKLAPVCWDVDLDDGSPPARAVVLRPDTP